jgi:hydroxyacyl-ACP dehydratase HTD2-like protein with hotdog domain
MSGEINFHADELIFQTATVNNAPSNNLDNAWRITGFDLYLPIGHSLYQPATLSISEDQQVVFEIAAVTSNTAAEFYAAPTGSIRADNITINDWNAGASYIEGIQLQHLKVQTHDLN